MKVQKLKAFIFDMDGTLIDSKLNFDAMREELSFPKGVPLLEHIESLGASISQEERKKYFDIIHKHELKGAIDSEIMEGCIDFLDTLKRLKIKTAVLTRNSLEVTQKTFHKWQLSFDMTLTRDCVLKPKPDPEGLFKICEFLKVSPYQAVYMGDFHLDLVAAKNAGMKSVLYSPALSKIEKDASYVTRSFSELNRDIQNKFLKELNFTL